MFELIFGDPTYLLAALAISAVVLLGLWWTHRNRRLLLALFVVADLAVVLVAADWLVQTDREQITAHLEEMARLTEAGDVAGAARHLHPSVATGAGPASPLDRDGLVALVADRLGRYKVTAVTLSNIQVLTAGARASSTVSSRISFAPDGMTAHVTIDWKLEWVKMPEGWQIKTVEITTPLLSNWRL